MSSASSTQPGTAVTKSPRRRTLQSGFSLMARGEPKIWLTGGMLVICLAMIASLLTLIVVSGLATFWPGPVDWLLLSDGQMDIGQPQRSEWRGDNVNKNSQPSRFYRTANFDLTNRHYRWFEPNELTASGIVRPEWALVIERQSWGRMLALPSHLSRPLATSDPELTTLIEAANQLQELTAELEPIAAEEPPLPLSELSAAITQRVASFRTQQLTDAINQAVKAQAVVQWQREEASEWNYVRPSLPEGAQVFAARAVTYSPEAMLTDIQPILAQLSRVRAETEHAMHTISLLDSDLSNARVAVRQAELDTGRSVIETIDEAAPLIEQLAANSLSQARIDSIQTVIGQQLKDTTQSAVLEQLLKRYRDKVLEPARQSLTGELDAWLQKYSQEPPAIRQAIQQFLNSWQHTLARKQPLEANIQRSELQMQGYELQVLVPSESIKLEVSEADSQRLFKGEWTDSVLSQLSAQSITPTRGANDAGESVLALRLNRLSDHVVQIEFDDAQRGLMSLWGYRNDNDETVWMLPQQKTVNCAEIVRLFPANRLTLAGKLEVYAARWREFLLDNPREANTEGGVFPAIWGTIVMTLIMTLAVVPFGVIAALYLREYTRSGPIVSLVRISINNLAGVPSIVYGVFGLAFFCYSMGAFIDGGAKNAQFGAMPSSAWYLMLATTITVGVVAFLFSLLSSGVNPSQVSSLKRRIGKVAPALWFLSLVGAGVLIFKSPFFDGLYEARLPAPTFGKEGLLWASLTLALLTLPVVIVATEEALSAVPNSLREGSLACGASKWQTIYRIVLPHARPGILTGAILAMARGIGEVAPLMLVGALPVAPDLPLDSEFPYFHGSRSFMHLGYQIYWLGFQSQNSEASKPLVFTCTLLLILIVISLNLAAILLRARLRRRFQGNQF